MDQTCTCCGTIFDADQPWKLLCYPCWRAKKDAENGDLGALSLRSIKAELLLSKAQDEIKRLQAIIYRESKRWAKNAPPEPIPPDLMNSMVLLCHPDRHGNSAASNKVTAWLLQQRARQQAHERSETHQGPG